MVRALPRTSPRSITYHAPGYQCVNDRLFIRVVLLHYRFDVIPLLRCKTVPWFSSHSVTDFRSDFRLYFSIRPSSFSFLQLSSLTFRSFIVIWFLRFLILACSSELNYYFFFFFLICFRLNWRSFIVFQYLDSWFSIFSKVLNNGSIVSWKLVFFSVVWINYCNEFIDFLKISHSVKILWFIRSRWIEIK